jgi:hypothetical protein
MNEVAERIDRLEAVLDQFMARTGEILARMDARAARQEEWSRKMDARAAEREEWSRKMIGDMNRKWGEVANRMGTLVEDIVAPNLPRIAREHFGCDEIADFMVRRRKRHPAIRGQRREFDVICVGERVVLWNETKATARPEYVDDFAQALPEFFAYFPEYQGRTLIPIFASLYLPEDIVRHLTRKGIYALAMGEETMQLLNLDELNPA